VTDALLLAIDAGTGSCRAVLFDHSGRQVAIGQREYSHRSLPAVPGSQVFDTQANWGLICECIREAVARAGVRSDSILAVSATSMREGMVCYDDRDREIWACPNVDARATEAVAELIESGLAEEIYARAGDWVAITAPARFRWIARHEPETFRSIAHVGMLGDWVLHRLSGAYVTDPSLGSSSGMFELAERDWSQPIIEMCGLERSVFPEVLAPGTVVGAVTRDAAATTGLRQGTPVTVGGADTQLSLVGIGVVEPGRFTIVGGSFWQHTVLLDEPLIDHDGRLRTLCHTSPGRWMMEGIGFYSGLTMRWFRDAFCAAEKRQCEIDGSDVYELLEAEAASVAPGSNGVVGIFSNLMEAKRWVHASPAFIGFDITAPERSGRAQCTRAIEESAAYVCLGHMRIVQELIGRAVDSAVFTGGGAKGSLWARILADVLGVPLAIPEVKESSALGAAMYAATAIGAYADIDEALTAIVRYERSVEPDAARHREYEALYEAWRTLYAGALELSEARLAPALWRAPGT
jgi:autoinducer-2 kinase